MSDSTAPTRDRVLVEVTIPTPADEVWRALRDPEQIRRWFGWDAPTLADEIDFIFEKYGRASEDERVLAFEGTSDRFELHEAAGGTVLRVVRAVAADAEWSDVYEEMTEGWISFVQQLRLALAQHRGEERRTIYISGGALAPGAPRLSEALGLSDLASRADGAAYAAEAAGEALKGQVWHRSPHQLGLTVQQWGGGLLIVTDKPANDARPNGGGALILTTYGLDEDAFAALDARWRDWWSARYNTSGGEGGEGCEPSPA